MKNFYGNLNNRFEENHYFNGTRNNIKEGTLCTIYMWSDRHAYEVVKVEDQSHLFIRPLKAVRTDDNGMCDAQDYKYESDPTRAIKEIKLTKYGWKEVNTFRLLDKYEDNNQEWMHKYHMRCLLTEKQFERVLAGETIKKIGEKVNISFGVADEYYDYSF